MDPVILAALIGVVGVIIGAVLQAALPGSTLVARLSGKPKGHSLVGAWKSSWGPLPGGPPNSSEHLTISRQRGDRLWGHITRDEELDRVWDVEGRYDGQFLQLLYFPSRKAKDPDFLDYGCYFFRRRADGSFVGYSTGFGEHQQGEGISTDYHELRRR